MRGLRWDGLTCTWRGAGQSLENRALPVGSERRECEPVSGLDEECSGLVLFLLSSCIFDARMLCGGVCAEICKGLISTTKNACALRSWCKLGQIQKA